MSNRTFQDKAVIVKGARREEQALAAEFGQQWIDYCRRVPGWIPRLGKRR